MPMIRIEFDDNKISDDLISALSKAVKQIVSETTGIEDVFVYANSARIKLAIAPIEIFIEMNAEKIKDQQQLVGDIKTKLIIWKKDNEFDWPINFTVIPMHWKVETNI